MKLKVISILSIKYFHSVNPDDDFKYEHIRIGFDCEVGDVFDEDELIIADQWYSMHGWRTKFDGNIKEYEGVYQTRQVFLKADNPESLDDIMRWNAALTKIIDSIKEAQYSNEADIISQLEINRK